MRLARNRRARDGPDAAERREAARRPLLSFYRTTLYAIGLAGIAFALILFRDATPANMQALPAGIVLLLSLGALLEGCSRGG